MIIINFVHFALATYLFTSNNSIRKENKKCFILLQKEDEVVFLHKLWTLQNDIETKCGKVLEKNEENLFFHFTDTYVSDNRDDNWMRMACSRTAPAVRENDTVSISKTTHFTCLQSTVA